MNTTKRMGGVILAIGAGGLALAFTSLIRDRCGTELYFALSLIALVAGTAIYFVGYRRGLDD